MLAVERMGSIVHALEKNESVTVTELSREFGVSEETIRRDLDKIIQKDPTVVRVHGGAYKTKEFDKEAPYHFRQTLMVDEKNRIARRCLSYLTHGDVIMLDSSTTALYLAKSIAQGTTPLTVITNSLAIASELSRCDHLKLTLTGGALRSSSQSFVGQAANEALARLYADKAFVSCSGLHIDVGLTDNSETEAQVRRLMLKNAGVRYLLVDDDKIGRRKTHLIAPLSEVDTLLTNAKLPPEWGAFAEVVVC